MAGYDRFDVVVVPFPFTDRASTKRRPALVLSGADPFNRATGHVLLAMITSARHSHWPLDTPIADLDRAGLPSPSMVRMKLFTLDGRFILRTLGRLADEDQIPVADALQTLLAGPSPR
jgi:mRNA interferase MazF